MVRSSTYPLSNLLLLSHPLNFLSGSSCQSLHEIKLSGIESSYRARDRGYKIKIKTRYKLFPFHHQYSHAYKAYLVDNSTSSLTKSVSSGS
jgi:hypothetical protein